MGKPDFSFYVSLNYLFVLISLLEINKNCKLMVKIPLTQKDVLLILLSTPRKIAYQKDHNRRYL